MATRRHSPGIARPVAFAPTDDSSKTLGSDPGALFDAARDWSPMGGTMLSHRVSVHLPTGGLVVSVTDVDIPYQGLPFRIVRTFDAQEQYAQWDWIQSHPNTDPRFHFFANWQFQRESLPSLVWLRTLAELLIGDGDSDNILFYREFPDFDFHEESSARISDRLMAYGIPKRMLQDLGYRYAPGDCLLRTLQGKFEVLIGRILGETLVDRVDLRLWRFDPSSGQGTFYTSEFTYDQFIGSDGRREVSPPPTASRHADGLGHIISCAPIEATPPYRTYVLTDGSGRTISLKCDDFASFIDGNSPNRLVKVPLVTHVEENTGGATYSIDYQYVDGRLTQADFPGLDAARRPYNYAYDDRGLLVEISDPLGAKVRFDYTVDLKDADERLSPRLKISRIRDSEGNEVTYAYDHPGSQVTAIFQSADGVQRSSTFRYIEDFSDTHQRYIVSERTDVASGPSAPQTIEADFNYSSDGRFNIVSVRDPLDQTALFEYDRYNQITATIDEIGHRRDMAYDARSSPSAAQPNRYDLLSTSETNVDLLGNPIPVAQTYSYESYGAATSGDPSDVVLSTHRLVQKVDPLGRTESYSYDDAANFIPLKATRLTDAGGYVTSRHYDIAGMLLSETDPLGNTYSWGYDGKSRIIENKDANGYARSWVRDPVTGWILFATDALGAAPGDPGHSIRYDWNQLGQLIAETDAVGAKTEYTYYSNRRLRSIRGFDPAPRDTWFTYDAVGLLLSMTDPLGRSTVFNYDEAGRLYKVGRDTALVPAVTFKRDALGRVTEMIDSNGMITRYMYDAVGRVIRTEEPSWPAATPTNTGKRCNLVYDHRGNRLQMTDSQLPNPLTYTYDAAGQLLRRTGAFGDALLYEYDTRGNLTRLHDGLGGIDLRFTRDANGQTSEVEDSAQWDPARRFTYRRTSATEKDNLYGIDASAISLSTDFAYNRDRRLTRITHYQSGTTIADFQYTYDPDGQLATISGDRVASFSYDGLKQLTNETDTGLQSTYDGDGNRLSREASIPVPGTESVYDADNRLIRTPYNQTTYQYDANGNLIERRLANGAATRYTFDGGNRLVTADDGQNRVAYLYDLDGRLLERTLQQGSATDVRRYQYGDRSVLATLDSNNHLMELYTRDDEGRLLRRRAAAPLNPASTLDPHSLYYIVDGQQSPVALIDADGTSRIAIDYDAWGTSTYSTGNAGDEPFHYRSGYLDPAIDTIRFGTRWYNPALSRWMSSDPLLLASARTGVDAAPHWRDLANLYIYSRNNPFVFWDPDGLGATLPNGWPQPPGWKGRGFGWKNVKPDLLEDPNGERWHWHPEDETHNEHWDNWDKRGNKKRLDSNGEDLGEDAFKEPDAEPSTEEGGEPNDEKSGDNVKRVAQAGAAAAGTGAALYGLWFVGKWVVAIIAAPETAGGSLAAAALSP